MKLLGALSLKEKIILSLVTLLLLASTFKYSVNFTPIEFYPYLFITYLLQGLAIVGIIAMSIVYFRQTKDKLFYYLLLAFSASAVSFTYVAFSSLLFYFNFSFRWNTLLAFFLNILNPLIIACGLVKSWTDLNEH